MKIYVNSDQKCQKLALTKYPESHMECQLIFHEWFNFVNLKDQS